MPKIFACHGVAEVVASRFVAPTIRRLDPPDAYNAVTLTNLDGSGFLNGDYTTVTSATGNPAYLPNNSFLYTRHQDEFEVPAKPGPAQPEANRNDGA